MGIGVAFAKQAGRDLGDFFVAGRTLPWWIAGTSLVASTFAADTPLFVAGLSRTEGVYGNWFWWSAISAYSATIFFFARLWRRTGAVTDVEFVTLRYEPSRARSFLRVLKVFYEGVFANCIVMALIVIASSKVIQVIMGYSDAPVFVLAMPGVPSVELVSLTRTDLLVVGLGFCAVAYSVVSGLYGVVYTDLIQFALAMVGSYWLAFEVYRHPASSPLVEAVRASPAAPDGVLDLVPSIGAGDLVAFTFFTYVLIAWWSQAPGSGYMVQRLLATRSERDSVLAFLWFSFCHYVLRPWPWIVVGVASLAHFPDLQGADAELAYPAMIDSLLPTGAKGVLIASLLAAYMSTLDTHLNWGASYLINDFYKPFINPNAEARHYVTASRTAMVALMVLGLLGSTVFAGILHAHKYLMVVGGGAASVMVLRWYWWRVTAWSELSALGASFVIGNTCEWWLADPTSEAGEVLADWFPYRLIASSLGTSLVWVGVTLATSRSPSQQAVDFYRRIRPAGPGWRRVASVAGRPLHDVDLRTSAGAWLACSVLLYALLLGSGAVLFGQHTLAAACGAAGVVAGAVLLRLGPAVLKEGEHGAATNTEEELKHGA